MLDFAFMPEKRVDLKGFAQLMLIIYDWKETGSDARVMVMVCSWVHGIG